MIPEARSAALTPNRLVKVREMPALSSDLIKDFLKRRVWINLRSNQVTLRLHSSIQIALKSRRFSRTLPGIPTRVKL